MHEHERHCSCLSRPLTVASASGYLDSDLTAHVGIKSTRRATSRPDSRARSHSPGSGLPVIDLRMLPIHTNYTIPQASVRCGVQFPTAPEIPPCASSLELASTAGFVRSLLLLVQCPRTESLGTQSQVPPAVHRRRALSPGRTRVSFFARRSCRPDRSLSRNFSFHCSG